MPNTHPRLTARLDYVTGYGLEAADRNMPVEHFEAHVQKLAVAAALEAIAPVAEQVIQLLTLEKDTGADLTEELYNLTQDAQEAGREAARQCGLGVEQACVVFELSN